jgi:hypothetical protein
MPDALIGSTGFVGSSLLRQRAFDSLYRSTNIHEIDGGRFDTVVCAGAPGVKWLANKEPARDRDSIDGLMRHLGTITCNTFVLISTVDVFSAAVDVDERSPVEVDGLQAYGRHRLELERFVAGRFDRPLIVRLPGLVGPGLRKNLIFDLLNDNNVDQVDGRSVFQFYPMVNLWPDIERALAASLGLVHLTAEPISAADVSEAGFGRKFPESRATQVARYDMRTCHASAFGADGHYQYDRSATLLAIRSYAQSEAPTLTSKGKT